MVSLDIREAEKTAGWLIAAVVFGSLHVFLDQHPNPDNVTAGRNFAAVFTAPSFMSLLMFLGRFRRVQSSMHITVCMVLSIALLAAHLVLASFGHMHLLFGYAAMGALLAASWTGVMTDGEGTLTDRQVKPTKE